MSSDLRFPAPIAVPRGKPLVTLRDAATYITTFPAATQHEQAWQNVGTSYCKLLTMAWYGREAEH